MQLELTDREKTFLLGLLHMAETYADSRLARVKDPAEVLRSAALYKRNVGGLIRKLELE